MTDQQRPAGQPGYRGALPPRNDALARPWVVAVIAAFVLIFVLSFLGLPGALFPDETSSPTPGASFSLEPSGSAEPSVQASGSPGS